MHTVYLGLGANLGDRQNNLVQALQLLRSQMTIEQVSSCYETAPVGYTEQPPLSTSPVGPARNSRLTSCCASSSRWSSAWGGWLPSATARD